MYGGEKDALSFQLCVFYQTLFLHDLYFRRVVHFVPFWVWVLLLF